MSFISNEFGYIPYDYDSGDNGDDDPADFHYSLRNTGNYDRNKSDEEREKEESHRYHLYDDEDYDEYEDEDEDYEDDYEDDFDDYHKLDYIDDE